MKKWLLLVVVLLGPWKPAFADTATATLYMNLGSLKLYLPIASGLDTTYLWDFNNKKSLIGGETPVATYKNLTFTGGAVTTIDGAGSPIGRVYYTVPNPAKFVEALNEYHVGIFVGKDFNIGGRKSYLYGIAASRTLW